MNEGGGQFPGARGFWDAYHAGWTIGKGTDCSRGPAVLLELKGDVIEPVSFLLSLLLERNSGQRKQDEQGDQRQLRPKQAADLEDER